MKKITLLLSLVFLSMGLSSCCSMFGMRGWTGCSSEHEYTTQVCGRDVVRTKKIWKTCPQCTRRYCLDEGCCGSSTKQARKMSTAQNSTGSPHIGLIPTMKPIIE